MSPGDKGPDGCGLLPENEPAVEFYNTWKTLGSAAFELLDDYVPESKYVLGKKLALIDQHIPGIQAAIAKHNQDKKDAVAPRTRKPRKKRK